MRSPLPPRRSARITSAETSELARDAASALLGDPSLQDCRDVSGKGGSGVSGKNPAAASGQGKEEKKIQKLDGNAYKPFGSRSRSSSDAGSDTAFCKGGLGKVCGEPVRSTDNGVLCDSCDRWFHSDCQGIPKQAYEALVLYKVLSWLCPECKKAVKNGEAKRMISIESRVEQLDKSMKEHVKLVTQSLREQEIAVANHTRLLERSVIELHSQKTSYADIVKGTCSEVVKEVSAKISSIPQASSSHIETRNGQGITKVLDDFMDKERRKNNLVIHNLPEADGGSREDRSRHDIRLFQDLMKDTFHMSVAVAKSFRVGKSVENRARLLIVTLETPGVKQDILRLAPQLRSCEKWSNIYITPDLTLAERETARKVREELVARRKAGEANITIRRGKIVPFDNGVRPSQGFKPAVRSVETASTSGLTSTEAGGGSPSHSQPQGSTQSVATNVQYVETPSVSVSGSREIQDRNQA